MSLDMAGLKKLNKAANAAYVDANKASDLTLAYHAQWSKALQLNKAGVIAFNKMNDKANELLDEVQQTPDASIDWYTTLKGYLDSAAGGFNGLRLMHDAVTADMLQHLHLVPPEQGLTQQIAAVDPEIAAKALENAISHIPINVPYNAQNPGAQDPTESPVEPDETEGPPWGWIAAAVAGGLVVARLVMR